MDQIRIKYAFTGTNMEDVLKAKCLFWIVVVSMFCACGDSNSPQSSGGGDPFPVPYGSENNTSSFRGWQFTFEGGEDVVELPDIEGSSLIVEQDRDAVRFVGETDVARLSFHFIEDGGFITGNMGPDYLRIDFKELNYRCERRTNQFTFSIETNQGIEADGRGTLTCISGMNPSRQTTFETQVEGMIGVTEGSVMEKQPADAGPGVFPEGPFPHEFTCPDDIVPLDEGGYGTLLRGNQNAGVLQAEIIDFDSGEVVYTTPDTLDVREAMVSSDGSVAAIEVSVDEQTSLAHVIDVENDQMSLLPLPDGSSDPSSSKLIAISAGGSIAYTCYGRKDAEFIEELCVWDDGRVQTLSGPPELEGLWDLIEVSGEFTADGRTLILSSSGFYMRIDVTNDELDFVYRADDPLPFLPFDSAGPISASADGSIVAFLGDTNVEFGPLLTVFDQGDVSGTVRAPEWKAPKVSPDGTRVAFNHKGALKYLEVGSETVIRMLWDDFQSISPTTTVSGSPFWIDSQTLIHYRRSGQEYRIYRSTLEPDLMSNAVTEVIACGSGAPGGISDLFYFSR